MSWSRSGLANTTVTLLRSIVSSTAGPSTPGGTTTVPPANNVGSTVTPRPPMRVNGAAASVTSAGPKEHSATIWITSHSTFPCERITPLGRPVVPDVYARIARSSDAASHIGVASSRAERWSNSVASTSGTPTSGCVAGDARISSRAPESSSTARTSSSGRPGWMGTHAAPIAVVANSETSADGWFLPWNATRSPTRIPRCRSIVAAARISRARSAYEREASAVTSAMLNGERAARRSIQVPRPANPIGGCYAARDPDPSRRSGRSSPSVTWLAMKQPRDPRIVVLVEGLSDQRALEALAARRGRDLDTEGVAVMSIGGSKNIGRFLDHYGPRGLDVGLAGLCDATEESDFQRGLSRNGFGADLTRAEMEELGFFVCVEDLEDELIRALGTDAVLHGRRGAGRSRCVPHVPAPTTLARTHG